MNRYYKYRLYPNKVQENRLEFILEQSRYVYNKALEQRKAWYDKHNQCMKYKDQSAYFVQKRRNDTGLSKINCSSMQQILRQLDNTYQDFFRRVKRGTKAGHPRFKPANRYSSLRFIYGDGIKIKGRSKPLLYVQNVGDIKVKRHRLLPSNARIKQVVIKCKNAKWYCCLVLSLPDPQPKKHKGTKVGIDMGIHWLLALSNGRKLQNPRWFRKAEARLRRAQRKLTRRKKGSNRRAKARLLVAKCHEHIANQRRDFWHKVTRYLVENHSLIALEDLTLAFMIKNRPLAKSATDAGLGIFQKMLRYKAEEAGTQVVFVDPKYTSQICSRCGEIVKKELSVRKHKCPHCGLSIDRDVNAARNILARVALSKPNVRH